MLRLCVPLAPQFPGVPTCQGSVLQAILDSFGAMYNLTVLCCHMVCHDHCLYTLLKGWHAIVLAHACSVVAIETKTKPDGREYYEYEINQLDATNGPHSLTQVTSKVGVVPSYFFCWFWCQVVPRLDYFRVGPTHTQLLILNHSSTRWKSESP